MVNTGRHGDTTLEYKPCQKHSACAEYFVQRESRPLSLESNGSEYNVHAQDTSATIGNNSSADDGIALYKYYQITEVSSSYSSITLPCGICDASRYMTSNECHLLDSLPYLEIPLTTGSRSLRSSNSDLRYHLPYSFPRLLVNFRLTPVIFYIIISMLLLCKGCTCFCSDNLAVSVTRPPYLTKLNESNMAAVSGQCLTMTGSVVETICEKPTTKREELLRKSNYRTNFCGLQLDSILSKEEKNTVKNCARDNGCARVLRHVQEIDEELSKMYCQFSDILERIDCEDMFPTNRNCQLCKAAYKRWLCSVYNFYYIQDEQIKPCIDFCDHVSETCPFFRPYGETLIGEPGFLCKDSKSLADAAASVYGPTGCCYKPCQVFDETSCPDLITQNCTAVDTSSSCSYSAPSRVLYVFIIYWIISSWFRLRTFPWNSCIGLT